MESILVATMVVIGFNKNLALTNILLGLVRIILVNVVATIINNTIKTTFYNNLIDLSLTLFLIYSNWFYFQIVIGNSIVLTKIITYSVLVLIIPCVMFLYIK